jgi:hypothetical protein
MIGELCRWCHLGCPHWESCENDVMKDSVKKNWVGPTVICLLAVGYIVYCALRYWS